MLVQGAHGDFSNLTTKSTVKRQASSNFTAIKRNQGGTFRNSRIQLGFRASTRTGQRSLEKHAHAQPRSPDHWDQTPKLYRSNACETYQNIPEYLETLQISKDKRLMRCLLTHQISLSRDILRILLG